MLTFVQIAKEGRKLGTSQRLPDSLAGRDLSPIQRYSEIRIRTKKRRDLLRLRLVDPNLPRSQRRIALLEPLLHLLPGQTRLDRRRPLGQPAVQDQAKLCSTLPETLV